MAGIQTQQTQADTPCRNTRSRAWCLTINNYNDQLYEDMKKDFPIDTQTQVVLGREVGANGTPHLQCCIKYQNPRSFGDMKKKYPTAHIEKCNNWAASVTYCKKEGNFYTNIVVTINAEQQYNQYMQRTFSNVQWRPWQQELINLLQTEPSERKVYWYWEQTGNTGKTFLAKYIDWKYNAIIANGKQGDVFNQYKSFLETEKKQPKVAIIDIPRSHQDYVCYSTLEKIKDGLVYSGKYEGGKLRLIPHHLIIFANFEPDEEKLSNDRWSIHEIQHG